MALEKKVKEKILFKAFLIRFGFALDLQKSMFALENHTYVTYILLTYILLLILYLQERTQKHLSTHET